MPHFHQSFKSPQKGGELGPHLLCQGDHEDLSTMNWVAARREDATEEEPEASQGSSCVAPDSVSPRRKNRVMNRAEHTVKRVMGLSGLWP